MAKRDLALDPGRREGELGFVLVNLRILVDAFHPEPLDRATRAAVYAYMRGAAETLRQPEDAKNPKLAAGLAVIDRVLPLAPELATAFREAGYRETHAGFVDWQQFMAWPTLIAWLEAKSATKH